MQQAILSVELNTKTLLARLAEIEPEIQTAPALRRCDLQALLHRDDWRAIASLGPLDPDGNLDAGSLNCTNAIIIIGLALERDRIGRYPHALDRPALEQILDRERALRAMFRERAGKRRGAPGGATGTEIRQAA